MAADFEEGALSASPSLNHPITGTTVIQNNVWYHAAVTYDSNGEYRLYLNGNLEASLSLGPAIWPQGASIQHSAIGTMLTSAGASNGLFQGAMDEVRIWNFARTQSAIRATVNSQLTTPQTGMIARWALDEGTGTVINGSAGTSFTGNVINTAYQWVPGAPFNINFAPYQLTLVAPPDNATGLITSPALRVSAADPESASMTITFYGRQVSETPPGVDFTIVSLPDAQNYTAGLSSGTMPMFTSQTNWCVNQRVARNIAYVAMEGDITNDNIAGQWTNGVTAMSILENPTTTGLTDGIPYGIAIGNHDGAPSTTTLYNLNTNFGSERFAGRLYYGGHYGSDNNNNYNLFRAGGMDFIVINLGYGTATPATEVFTWANGLLQTYSDRRAIIVSHNLLASGDYNTPDRAWDGPGQTIYNALRGNANLFLMLCGHLDSEGMRTDTYNGHTVYTVLSDYQAEGNGGSGWMRIFSFSPTNNTITVSSYSPHLNSWNWTGNQPVVLPYVMSATNPFETIGTASGVISGNQAEMIWNDLKSGTEYEWYVTVSDGQNTVTGPVWSFTTAPQAQWTGTLSNNWTTPGNWQGNLIPGTANDAVIPDVANDPVIDATSSADCHNLTVQTGATLTIQSTVSSSGSLIVHGNATGNVTYNRLLRHGDNAGDKHLFSSPVGGQRVDAFRIAYSANIDNLRTWDEPAAVWSNVVSEFFTSGKGYNVYQPDAGDGNFSFTGTVVRSVSINATSPYFEGYSVRYGKYPLNPYGTLNPAQIVWAQDRGWTTGWGSGGWNLLGNPFTSAMTASAFITANNASFDPFYQALYVYDGLTSEYKYSAASIPGFPVGNEFAWRYHSGRSGIYDHGE